MSTIGILSSTILVAGVGLVGFTLYRLNRVAKRLQQLQKEVENGKEKAHSATEG
jgi:uncharacterized membrane-anchored protein YhcB (DUF1043 family)